MTEHTQERRRPSRESTGGSPVPQRTPTPVPRTDPGAVDTPFNVKFVERLYEGPERWYSDRWGGIARPPSWDRRGRLGRSPECVAALRLAHRVDLLHDIHQAEFLATCMNPECERRTIPSAGSG